MDLDVRMKAVMLGACMLIVIKLIVLIVNGIYFEYLPIFQDMMYLQRDRNQQSCSIQTR